MGLAAYARVSAVSAPVGADVEIVVRALVSAVGAPVGAMWDCWRCTG